MSQAGTRKPSNDDEPEDIDAFRNRLARHLSQLISREQGVAWGDCPERVCRRHRQCVAPRIHCSNAPPDTRTPEERAAGLAEVQAEIYKALAAYGVEQE